ncbi:MAG: hypothetical protein IV108_01410 [Burkholderiales bacterium]|nr:hypothetical protein [Burkholderiales bacterium]
MEKDIQSGTREPEDRPYTAPKNLPVTVRGFDMEERATQFAHLAGVYIQELSRQIDLSRLDGVTIAFDYNQALLDLDRGYLYSHRLTPSDEFAIGVAMTPSVIRDGIVKSHIVLNAALAIALEDPNSEHFKLALHTLAHECAHVEITHRFDTAFPNVLLQNVYKNIHDAARWQINLACWDEYAATWISAPFGHDPTAGYEETFILLLNETRSKANALIKAYRRHGDVTKIMAEIYAAYGSLMKFAAYHLGNMAGQRLSLMDLPKTKAALKGHWFASYFERLGVLCKRIADDYGHWSDQSSFEALGDLADELVVEGGLIVSHRNDGSLYMDIPFTSETMPE